MRVIVLVGLLWSFIFPAINNYQGLINKGGDIPQASNHFTRLIKLSEEYDYIPWRTLLSEEEIDFYQNEMIMYNLNPEYEGGTAPAPGVNPEINNRKVRILGFIVGVDTVPGEYNKLSSFLFVPNSGTCIHIPPPPPNQTIFVEMKKSVKVDPLIPFYLEGTIYLEKGENEITGFYYRMDGKALTKYN